MKGFKVIVWIVIIALIVWGVVASVGKDDDTGPIKLGFIGPLTGDAASLGESMKTAISIAVEEINSDGGISGRNVEVTYEDAKCNGAEATKAANKLVNVDKVHAIVGGLCSAETLAVAGVTEPAKVPTISPTSSAPSVTNAGDYIFRVYPSDSFQGVFAAGYVKNDLNKSKAGVVYVNDEWGSGLQQAFQDAFKDLGGEITAVEAYNKTDRDLRSQLTKVKTSNPDAIFFVGFSEASAPAIKQMKELGINVPVIGGDAWDDDTIWSNVGSAGEGFRFVTPFSPENLEFKTKMEAKGDSPKLGSSQVYDIVNIYKDVISKVGTSPEKIKNELYNIQDYNGVSGKIGFDKNGDLKDASYVVHVIHNGKSEIEK